jgi:riboflavin kinase/FMN adenylyltransferase
LKIIRSLAEFPADLRGGAAAIGNFDGVHLGHARIAERLIAAAAKVGGPAIVFTFEPHPVRVLRPDEAPPPLTWTERKAELLVELGVDWMVAYPTDEALLELSPEQFFDQIVRKALDARALVEGPNFYFGHKRAGDISLLGQFCQRADIALDVVQPYEKDGEFISSSRIRRQIAAGEAADAAAMLTQPYRVRGLVTHGAGRGGKIGFPTANVDAIDTLLPAAGVYAGRAYVDDASWPAAINLGPNPTFGEDVLKLEVHLIGLDAPLYGRPLEVDFRARLRDIQPFDSVESLQRQLAADVRRAKEVADAH